MLDSTHPLAELLRRDKRYHFDSYVFVFDALKYGQEKMNLGSAQPSAPGEAFDSESLSEGYEPAEAAGDEAFDPDDDQDDRHVTGQELCEAIRRYALEQYGLLARSVLEHWGVTNTGDFGEIVFNLIDIGQMRKTESDRREDFQDVFDFESGFATQSVFQTLQPSKGNSQ